jgi:hypothetical protein
MDMHVAAFGTEMSLKGEALKVKRAVQQQRPIQNSHQQIPIPVSVYISHSTYVYNLHLYVFMYTNRYS